MPYRRAGPGPRTDWEPVRAPMRSSSTTRARSTTSLDPQHGVVVMETWRQCIRSIQILTAMVMKYDVSVDCQESYIFPRGYIFPKRAALRENIITRENITILAPATRDISSVPVNIWYIRWSKWMISSKFDGVLWLSQSSVTRLGVCVHNNLNANLTAWRTFYYDVLLLTAAYSDYAGHFFLDQFPNVKLLLLLLSLYSLLNLLYFPGWWNITLLLTGCLCALNYMSKPDHLI